MSTSLLPRDSSPAEQQKDPQTISIPALVEKQAAEHPDAIAIVGGGTALSYGELDALSNTLAHRLRNAGVGEDVRVALYMSRSPLAVVAALGVLKAGGAYLPIDETCPLERLAFILMDAEVPLVLTDQSGADQVPDGSWQVYVLEPESLKEKCAEASPTHLVSPGDVAYVIYTSGTTGTPKGVEITHSNLANLVRWHLQAFDVTTIDRTSQFASFGFDAAVWELWPNLAAGAAIHIVPEDARTSPKVLRDWLVDQEITISFVPTAIAEQLITSRWPTKAKLRVLLTGADTLHYYPVSDLPFRLINNYGPTEATVVATSGIVPASESHQQRPSIGSPIRNTRVYICDEFPNVLPQGQVGELYIGGAGVGRGYVNRPDLTSERFLPDSISRVPGALVYRTGDLARVLPNGEISFVGRADDQLKIRGYRIEPNEIVDVLNTHPSIQASAVIARDDCSAGVRIVAYIVCGSDPAVKISVSELREFLATRLPDYMIPAVFVSIASLPTTTNGKVDRAALPAPHSSNILRDAPSTTTAEGEPLTLIEKQLAESIAELLGLEEVERHDNFFLIGGHSLFGAQLIARIQDSFGLDLPLRTVFDSPTVAELAQQIEAQLVKNIDAMSEDEAERALEHNDLRAG